MLSPSRRPGGQRHPPSRAGCPHFQRQHRTRRTKRPTKLWTPPNRVPLRPKSLHTLVRVWPPAFYLRECVMSSEDVVPPLAANMNAAFKKVRGVIGATDPALADLIVTRIVELAKDGVFEIEELSSRTLTSLKLAG